MAKERRPLASIDIEYGAGCGAASALRSISTQVYRNLEMEISSELS
jgi:hypothetical protein